MTHLGATGSSSNARLVLSLVLQGTPNVGDSSHVIALFDVLVCDYRMKFYKRMTLFFPSNARW